MRIAEYNKEKKKESYASWYLLAVIVGVALFYFFLFATKTLIIVGKFAIEHWIWFTVGVLLLLLLIKRLKKPKEIPKYEDQYR